ncbi:MAG TPA: phosphoenolpyruvate--protein phosphotransferase [Polyangia bacterium]|jgi:phosphotransferase system enzyme I (PtsI)|nr:phosphoenolpyruvate--protein phosphotransferase [Polyangia bacterium]
MVAGRHLKGIAASGGVAIGPAHLLVSRAAVAERRILRGDREAELARLTTALRAADEQLDGLRQFLAGRSADGEALIEVQRLMLRSPEIEGETRRMIADEALAAEWAVTRAMEHVRATFAALPDPFFRARGADFEAVGERLVRVLLGLPDIRPGAGARKGSIAVCFELTPLDPYQLERAGVIGIVSERGGKTSHAALVARDLGIPYVAGIKNLGAHVPPDATLIVDGSHGELVFEPDAETLARYQSSMVVSRQRSQALTSLRDLPSVTLDEVRVHLAANVESVAGISAARAAGAESIGLMRTEFLYLDRTDLPSEAEQYADAISALRAADGIPVTFRTLDLGGDKLPAALRIATGANPALGMRSMRFSLERPDIFRTQLRALYRASSHAPMRLMLPLVSGVTELERAIVISDDVASALGRKGNITVGQGSRVPLGVMIETPSAALTADHLARRCDFLSLGTNDLMQYAFAADRDNDDVAYLYQPLHPAMLRLLKTVIDAARLVGVPLSICGDMASDPMLTWILVGLGLRELSMDPSSIPLVKSVVRGLRIAEAEALAAEALTLESEVQVGELVGRRMTERLPPEVAALAAL